MFGDVYGDRRIISKIRKHPIFKEKETSLTESLIEMFGPAYLRAFGWPDLESRLQIRSVVDFLQPRPSDNILDIGCSFGLHSSFIASTFGSKVVGIDIDSDDISLARFARNVNKINGLSFHTMDVSSSGQWSNFPKNLFDKVICLAVLEHIERDSEAVKNICKSMKPKGKIVITVPTDTKTRHKPDVDREKKGYVRPGQGHVREGYSVETMRNLLENNGMELISYTFVHRIVEDLFGLMIKKTSNYALFPFAYPFSRLGELVTNNGTGLLFRAMKK